MINNQRSYSMKYFGIFLVLMGFALTPYLVSNSFAICVINEDWSDAPCYTKRGEDPSLNQMKREWSQYYEFKGTEWMESKKLELMQAIQNGNLLEWKKEDHDSSHHNVYMYYFLIGDIPNEDGLFAEEYYGVRVLSPQQQSASGIPFSEIHCGIDLILIQKYDGSPSCVTNDTGRKLVERGWATCDYQVKFTRGHPCGISSSSGMSSSSEIIGIDVVKEGKIFDVKYLIKGATIQEMIFSNYTNSLAITIDVFHEGELEVTVPRDLLDARLDYCPPRMENSPDDTFFVLRDGVGIEFDEIKTTSESRTLQITFLDNSTKIEVIGTCFI